MNNCDCKPIGEYSKAEIYRLEQEYRTKLKASGFQDIERWPRSVNRKTAAVRFIKGHTRWHLYKTKEGFFRQESETVNYYRVIEIYSHNATMPEKYRTILQCYANNGSIQQSIKEAGVTVTAISVYKYLERNFPKMLTYVNETAYDE